MERLDGWLVRKGLAFLADKHDLDMSAIIAEAVKGRETRRKAVRNGVDEAERGVERPILSEMNSDDLERQNLLRELELERELVRRETADRCRRPSPGRRHFQNQSRHLFRLVHLNEVSGTRDQEQLRPR